MKISKIKGRRLQEPTIQEASKIVKKEGLAKSIKLADKTIEDLIEEKSGIDSQLKILTDRKSELSDRIKMIAETNGIKDANGSYNYIYEYQGERYVFSKNARTSRKFNAEKALTYFKKKRKSLLSSVLDTIEVINESKVETLLINNKITKEELSDMFEITTNYAGLLNKIKDEQPNQEVMQVTQSVKETSKVRRIRR